VAAHAVVLTSAHQPLGSPLLGGEIAIRTLGSDSTLSLIIGAAAMRGHGDRFGSLCVGLVPSGADCSARPIRDDGRVVAGSVGAVQPIVRAHRVRLSIIGNLALAQFHVESRYKPGGAPLIAEKVLVGAELGGSAAWYPAARVPLAIEIAVAIGGFAPLVSEQVTDGYTPFESDFSTRRIRAGLSWRVR